MNWIQKRKEKNKERKEGSVYKVQKASWLLYFTASPFPKEK